MTGEWGTWVLVGSVVLALVLVGVVVVVLLRGNRRETAPHPAVDGGGKVARELAEFRKDLAPRMKTIEERVNGLDRKMSLLEQGIHESVSDVVASDAAPRYASVDDFAPSELRSLSDDTMRADLRVDSMDAVPALSAAPEWRPAPSDLPVEVRDGALATSDSLPPAAYVVVDGGGAARVFLNPEVPLNEFALTKWEQFFELGRRQPYAAYHTLRAAEVAWDASAGLGTLIQKGRAEAS